MSHKKLIQRLLIYSDFKNAVFLIQLKLQGFLFQISFYSPNYHLPMVPTLNLLFIILKHFFLYFPCKNHPGQKQEC